MATLRIKCPECGIETDEFEFNVGMDMEMCLACDARIEYDSLKRDHDDLEKWLRQTHLKQLNKLKVKMGEAKEKMERLKR